MVNATLYTHYYVFLARMLEIEIVTIANHNKIINYKSVFRKTSVKVRNNLSIVHVKNVVNTRINYEDTIVFVVNMYKASVK